MRGNPRVKIPIYGFSDSCVSLLPFINHTMKYDDRIPDLSGAIVLDMGCGRGTGTIIDMQGRFDVRVINVDYNLEHLSEDRYYPRKEKVVADGVALPFSDQTFGAVVTSYLTLDNPYFEDNQ